MAQCMSRSIDLADLAIACIRSQCSQCPCERLSGSIHRQIPSFLDLGMSVGPVRLGCAEGRQKMCIRPQGSIPSPASRTSIGALVRRQPAEM